MIAATGSPPPSPPPPSPGLALWTAGLWFQGEDRLDVSRWGNHPLGVVFAPSEQLLYGFKALKRKGLGANAMRAEFARYAEAYRAEMVASATWHPAAWAELLARPTATICCYCRNAAACHRTVLAALLVARGARYEGERLPGEERGRDA